jgi:hypothetical protein
VHSRGRPSYGREDIVCRRDTGVCTGCRASCVAVGSDSVNINIPVRYNDPESINNIRHVLSYLAKEEQKEVMAARTLFVAVIPVCVQDAEPVA